MLKIKKQKPKITIVVPTIRKNSINRFLKEWCNEFFNNKKFNVNLLLVEDNPEKTFVLKQKNLAHYSWQNIKKDLGKNSWIIPRRTDCIRSYGYWKAWQQKPDMIVTLDDDCYPLEKSLKRKVKQKGFLETHWKRIIKGIILKEECWINTIKNLRPRGIPYQEMVKEKKYKNIILNHGLWYNVPDLDAKTQLSLKKVSGLGGYAINQIIPKNKYYPMCGMNLAWSPDATPALYFLLMGQNRNGKSWGFDRFGDIWSGIIFKKIADHLKYNICSGNPIIWHDRASNALINYKKEAPGLKVNEYFWQSIDKIKLTKNNFKDCYKEIAQKLPLRNAYWTKLKRAMQLWANLF